MWVELERRIQKHDISSKNQLKSILPHQGETIQSTFTQKVVDSMQKTLTACHQCNAINAKIPSLYSNFCIGDFLSLFDVHNIFCIKSKIFTKITTLLIEWIPNKCIINILYRSGVKKVISIPLK